MQLEMLTEKSRMYLFRIRAEFVFIEIFRLKCPSIVKQKQQQVQKLLRQHLLYYQQLKRRKVP